MFRLLADKGMNERINSLPKREAGNCKNRLKLLKTNPFPDGKEKKGIKGLKKSVYRLMAGSYRFFYIISLEERIVKVTEFLTAEQAHGKFGRI